jgi:uncharacterized membrane protein YeaQ/YmgE (transglycosylase-associated protein family)
MSPLAYLCVAVVLVAAVALTGTGPKGAKPVGRTRLMKTARGILIGGVIGDIVLGIVGAFLGGLIFRALHLHMPFRGVASTIFVAFVGAVALLLLMRVVRRMSGRSR